MCCPSSHYHLQFLILVATKCVIVVICQPAISPNFIPVKDLSWDVPSNSCETELQNQYEFGYDYAGIFAVSLYSKKYRLGSYVGYPCSTKLYEKFQKEFFHPYLECPFRQGLEQNFREFVNESLFQNANVSHSLIFQYICFSQQFEECRKVPSRDAIASLDTNNSALTCDGECQCIDVIPLDPQEQYRKPLTALANPPTQILQGTQCGVITGGICVAQWVKSCTNLTMDMSLLHSHKYTPDDFNFKCEANAGCHTERRICECAKGHSCENSGGSKAIINSEETFVIVIMYFFFLASFH